MGFFSCHHRSSGGRPVDGALRRRSWISRFWNLVEEKRLSIWMISVKSVNLSLILLFLYSMANQKPLVHLLNPRPLNQEPIHEEKNCGSLYSEAILKTLLPRKGNSLADESENNTANSPSTEQL